MSRRPRFYGEFLDTLGAQVTGDGGVRYGVHRDPKTGKRACVLVNYAAQPKEIVLSFKGHENAAVQICRPFEEPVGGRGRVSIRLPVNRLAVAIEV